MQIINQISYINHITYGLISILYNYEELIPKKKKKKKNQTKQDKDTY